MDSRLGDLHPEEPLGPHLDAGDWTEVVARHRADLGPAHSGHALPPVPLLGVGLAGHLGLLLALLQSLPGLDDVVVVLTVPAVPDNDNDNDDDNDNDNNDNDRTSHPPREQS